MRRELLEAEDPARWPHWGDRLKERAFADEVADFCLLVEQNLHSSESLTALTRTKPDWAEVVAFVDVYRAHLRNRSRMDYAQMISSAVRLLEQDPSVAAALRAAFPPRDGRRRPGHGPGPPCPARAPADLRTWWSPGTRTAGSSPTGEPSPDWVYGFDQWFGDHNTVILGDQNRRIGAPLAPALGRLIRHNDDQATHRPTRAAWRITPLSSSAGSTCRRWRRSSVDRPRASASARSGTRLRGRTWRSSSRSPATC